MEKNTRLDQKDFNNKYKVYKINIVQSLHTDTVESVATNDGNNIVENVSYQPIIVKLQKKLLLIKI